MYGRRTSPDEQRFYQLLLRELHRYDRIGTALYVEEQKASPEEVAYLCAHKAPGEYMAVMDRDVTGTVHRMHFFRVIPQDFAESGRLIYAESTFLPSHRMNCSFDAEG